MNVDLAFMPHLSLHIFSRKRYAVIESVSPVIANYYEELDLHAEFLQHSRETDEDVKKDDIYTKI